MTLTTYDDLDRLLHHKRSGKPVPSRKVANHTYVQRREDGSIAVKLHDTDVLTFESSCWIRLDSGGWLTMTTRDRMNRYLPDWAQIHSMRGSWSLRIGTYYRDGMRVDVSGGTVMDGMAVEERLRADRHNRQMSKLIDRYLRGWDDTKHTQMIGTLDVFGCSLCLIKDGTLIGQEMGDVQHLIEHLMEKRLPRSVWAAACVARAGDRGWNRMNIRRIAMDDLRWYLRGQLYTNHASQRRVHHAA